MDAKKTTSFNFYARNFRIKELKCDNGRFSNNSNSFIPVQATINGVTLSIPRGNSSSLLLTQGVYTTTVSRSRCNTYNIGFGVSDCGAAAKNKIEIKEVATFTPDPSSTLEDLKIYPNPFVQYFTVNLNDLDTDKVSVVIVLDTFGREVYRNTISGVSAKVRLNNLEAGYYFVQVIDEKGNVLKNKK